MAVILTLVAAASAILAQPPSQAEADETLEAVVLIQRVAPNPPADTTLRRPSQHLRGRGLIDELAAAAKADRGAFRLSLLDANPRAKAVL